jgi:hypothetical protein
MPATGLFSQWPVREGTVWTPQRVAWVSLLMAWGEGQTLSTRFQHACDTSHELHQHWKLGSSYSGFAQAMVRRSPEVVEGLKKRLRGHLRSFTKKFRDRDGFCILAVDGSRIECPHTAVNEAGLGCAGRQKTGPQVFVTTLWHARLGLPWDFRTGPGTDSERRHLDQMLDDLPDHTLLLADAGFVSFDLCRALLEKGHAFVLRVGSNVQLLTGLDCEYEQHGDIVSLWPTKRRSLPPLKLRLIRLPDKKGRTVCLLTSILEKKPLSEEKAKRLYRMRWGIEVFYRSFKQTLQHGRCSSRTPATCLAEAQWMMLGLWLLGLMAVRQQLPRGLDPLKLSVAKARDAVRRATRSIGRSRRGRPSLSVELTMAVHDTYTRHGTKTARNYPRKKRERPPGPPKIKPATPQEQELAKELRLQMTAVT